MKFLSWLVLIAVGFFTAQLVLNTYTVSDLPTLARILPISGAAVCVPLWKFYDNLRKLREHSELNKKELREVNYKIMSNVRKTLFNMIYLMLGAAILTIALLTFADPKHTPLAITSLSIYSFTAIGILANVLHNIKEIELYENQLAMRKKKKETAENLLKKMKSE